MEKIDWAKVEEEKKEIASRFGEIVLKTYYGYLIKSNNFFYGNIKGKEYEYIVGIFPRDNGLAEAVISLSPKYYL